MLNRSDSADGGAVPVDGHITRRNALTGLVSAGALAVRNVGPAPATTDPILAAIARHGDAWIVVGDLCRATDEVAATGRGHKVTQIDLDAYDRANAKVEQALDELLATPPETVGGMRATITYILAFDDGYLADLARPFLTSLLKSPLLTD